MDGEDMKLLKMMEWFSFLLIIILFSILSDLLFVKGMGMIVYPFTNSVTLLDRTSALVVSREDSQEHRITIEAGTLMRASFVDIESNLTNLVYQDNNGKEYRVRESIPSSSFKEHGQIEDYVRKMYASKLDTIDNRGLIIKLKIAVCSVVSIVGYLLYDKLNISIQKHILLTSALFLILFVCCFIVSRTLL